VRLDVVEQRAEDGRHTGDERRALGLDELRQRVALQERARQEHPGAGERGAEREPPGVDVEHRHDRQHAVSR
jgi:hypothetical protein